jgi:hypothetical protein
VYRDSCRFRNQHRRCDFDNDRNVDLAVPARDGGQSRIYFNDGKANFTRTLPFGPDRAAARVGSAADFDRDGDLDLVVGDEAAALMVVYMNDGRGNLREGFKFQDRTRVPYALSTGDLNLDGRPDIVIGYISARPSVFFNTGNGSQFTQVEFGDGKGSAYGFALGDLDSDGAVDIAHARSGAPNVPRMKIVGAKFFPIYVVGDAACWAFARSSADRVWGNRPPAMLALVRG